MNPFHGAWPSSPYCVDSEVTERHLSSSPILVDAVIKAHLGSPKVTLWDGKYDFGSLWKIFSPMCSFIIIQIYDVLLSCLLLFLFHIFLTLTKILLFSFFAIFPFGASNTLIPFDIYLPFITGHNWMYVSTILGNQIPTLYSNQNIPFFPTQCNINLPQIPWLFPILIR